MYTFIDVPRPRSLADYAAVTERFVERLSRVPGVRAIYQLGSVSDAGISDLDFLVVVEGAYRGTEAPLAGVPAEDRYLITHAPFGVETTDVAAALRFSLFHNYRHLWGDRVVAEPERSAEDTSALERQIALEYLVQMFVNLSVQRAFGVFKLRGLFLHLRALLYDLDYLGERQGPMRDVVERLVAFRRGWFARPASGEELNRAIARLADLLPGFVERNIARHGFFLTGSRAALSRNITLTTGRQLAAVRRGLLLPRQLHRLGPRYFSLQHRFNRFAVTCPFETETASRILVDRAAFLSRLRLTHSERLPGFLPPTSSLNAA